ncbi:unnamed protein product, partial [Symbiodinium sp. CCMP2456]
MEDAKASLTAKGSVVDASQYPAFFAGTLVVTSSGSTDMPENKAETAADTDKEAANTDKDVANADQEAANTDNEEAATANKAAEDAAIWQQLEHGRAYDEERRQAVDSYAHSVTLEKDGKPTAVIRAAPGEDVELHAKGWIQNKEGDTSLHQLLLVLDTTIIAEVYDSIPGGGDTFDT